MHALPNSKKGGETEEKMAAFLASLAELTKYAEAKRGEKQSEHLLRCDYSCSLPSLPPVWRAREGSRKKGCYRLTQFGGNPFFSLLEVGLCRLDAHVATLAPTRIHSTKMT